MICSFSILKKKVKIQLRASQNDEDYKYNKLNFY